MHSSTTSVRHCNHDDIPAIAQAAVADAEFETIHPFGDGNGRAGRCLIHVILRRRGLAARVVPPISVVLATNARRYIAGLTDFRDGRIDDWIGAFADTVTTASTATLALSDRVHALLGELLERAGSPRRELWSRQDRARVPEPPDHQRGKRCLDPPRHADRRVLCSIASKRPES